jgi:hypothetical protein
MLRLHSPSLRFAVRKCVNSSFVRALNTGTGNDAAGSVIEADSSKKLNHLYHLSHTVLAVLVPVAFIVSSALLLQSYANYANYASYASYAEQRKLRRAIKCNAEQRRATQSH